MSRHTRPSAVESRPQRKPGGSRAIAAFRRIKQRNAYQRFWRPMIERLEDRCMLAVISWDGGPAGTGTDWNTATNWVGDVLPGQTDDAQIGAAFKGITITHAIASTNIRSLTSAASLQLLSGSFSIVFTAGALVSQIDNPFNIDGGTLTLTGATLTGSGTINNLGTLNVTNSSVGMGLTNASGGQITTKQNSSFVGTFSNALGATLAIGNIDSFNDINTSPTLTIASGFTNAGLLRFTVASSNGSQPHSATLNITGGTLINTGTISSTGDSFTGLSFANQLNAELDNQGTLAIGARPLIINKPGAHHANSGIINVNGNDLTVTQSGAGASFANGGAITVAGSRTLSFNGGTFRYDTGVLSGDGTLEFNGTAVQLTADLTDTLGLLRAVGGTTVNGPGRLTLQQPLLLRASAINADLENKSSISVFGSPNAINGTLHNAPESGLGIFSEGGCGGSTPAALTVDKGFINEGKITLFENNNFCGTGTGPLTFTVASGVLVNMPTGFIRSQTARADFPANVLNAAVDNQGTLQIDHDLNMAGALSSLTTSGAINIADSRTLTISGGAFDFNAGTFDNFGPLVINNSTFKLTPDFALLPGRSITLNGTTVTGGGTLTNQGTLNVINSSVGVGLTNASGGQIMTTGTTSSFTGTFSNALGATLAIGNGAGNTDAGLTIASGFTNAGFLGFTAVSSNGSQPHSAVLNVTSGTLVNTGTISSSGNRFTSLGFDNQLNTELDNEGTISIGDRPLTINKPGAHHSNSGTISLASGQLFAITSGTLTNLSVGTLTGGSYLIAGTFQFPNAAIATNASNIVLEGSAARIVNQSNGNALSAFTSNQAGASLTLRNGASIDTQAAVTNAGNLTIGVASTLTIAGDYTQSATAAFNVEIGGAATDLYGKLTASGNATLGGHVGISLVNGFGPLQEQVFTVQTFAGHTGDFATHSGLNLGQTPVFKVVTEAIAVKIIAIADGGDLLADANSIVIQPNGTSGEDVPLTYTIRNTSTTLVPGDWFDSLYLSADFLLDAGDALIGRIEHTGGLDGSASYTTTATLPLPGTVEGDYRVIVVADSRGLVPDRDRSNNMAVSNSLIRTNLPLLKFGQTTSVSLDGGKQLLFRLDVPAGSDAQLGVNFSQAGVSAPSGVFVLFGQIPTPGKFTQSALSSQGLHQDLLLLGTAGPHYVLVRNADSAGNVQTIDLTPVPLTFSLQSVGPDHGSNVGQVTVTVHGTGFGPDDSVVLQNSAGARRAAQRVLFKDPNTVFGTFDLTGLETGSYDLRVTKGAGVVTSAAAFLVTSGLPGHVIFQVTSPPKIRVGAVGKVTVDYLNDGDTDVPAPLVLLKAGETPVIFPHFPIITAASGGGGGGGSGATSGSVFGGPLQIVGGTIKLQFLAINQDGLGGVLSPGARGHVELEFRAPNQPGPPDLFFTALIDKKPAATNLKKDDLRPPTVSPEAWDVLFAKFLARVGSSDLDYQTALDDAATYLSQIGQSTSNVGQLTAFLVEQMDNAYPGGILAAGIDAAAPAAGLPLTLARIYSQPISRRYELGAFGRGWSHSYETTLVHKDDLIIIHGPGGDRAFKKDIPDLTKINPPVTFSGQFGDPGKIEFLPRLTESLQILTDPDGTKNVFSDDTGRLLEISDSNFNRVNLNYTNGQLTSAVHSNHDIFVFDYNALGRISQITDQAGRVTTYTYDVAGEHLLQVTGPQGTVAYTYDTGHGAASEHALTSVTNLDGTHVFYSYDSEGRLIHSEGDGGAQAASLTYGPQGAVAFTDAAGATGTVFFDALGNAAQVRDALGQIVIRTFDSNSHLDRERLPGNLTVDHDFSATGFLDRIVDPSGHEVRTQFVPTSSGFGFSANTRLVSISDELGIITNYNYGTRGNLASIQYPQGPSPLFSHDAVGNLTAFQNRRGQAIQYTHNARGQLTRKSHADGTHEDYTYDNRSNLLTASDEHGKTTFQYDAGDRPTRVTYPGGRFLAYTRDAGGRVTRLEAQDGFAVNYAYDAAGRLVTVRDVAGAALASYTYDAVGRLIRQDHANGTFTTYDHDVAGQVTHLVNHAPDNVVNSRFDYAYDNLGRRTQMTTLDGAWTYEYDALGQLTHALFVSTNIGIPNQDLQYEYDPAGNRIRTTQNGVVTPYTTNKLDQYTLVGAATHSYDADGHLIAVGSGATGTSDTFDDEGRLIGVTTPAGTWTYEYDALGRRIASVHNGQRTEYLLDPTGTVDVVGEYSGTGSALAHYAYGLGLASRVGADGTADFYDFDGTGSTAGLTGTSGSYVNAYSYLPFGEPLASPQETVANPFGYVGQFGVMQEGNGLDFMRARYYSPTDGRFISADPIGIQGGINLYRYATNDPVAVVDPSGLVTELVPYIDQVLTAFLEGRLQTAVADAEAAAFAEEAAATLPEAAALVATEGSAVASAEAVGGLALRGFVSLDALAAIAEVAAATALTAFLVAPNLFIDTLNAGVGVALHYYFPGLGGFFNNLVCDKLDCDQPDPVGGSPTSPVRSLDPNDITGPGGFGAQGFLTPDFALPYTIHFENVATANAPAQAVVVTQQLDADLDFSSFELGNIRFGEFEFGVSPGLQSFSARFDVREQLGIFLDIAADFNPLTGLATWTFTSVDPTTFDLPVDPGFGFLPPNVTSPAGEGFVSYTIRAKAGAITGTRFDAQGRVVFDTNAPLDTPVIFNTIDSGKPTSTASPLPFVQPLDFNVQWSGTDDTGGSGVATFDVFVADSGGPFTRWLHDTPLTSSVFAGTDGHTYAFFSVIADHVGNQQLTPAQAQTSTTARLHPWQNPLDPLDVGVEGNPTPTSALIIINLLNSLPQGASGLLPTPTLTNHPLPFYDADGDDYITPTDALVVINWLNAQLPSQMPLSEGEAPNPAANSGSALSAANLGVGQLLVAIPNAVRSDISPTLAVAAWPLPFTPAMAPASEPDRWPSPSKAPLSEMTHIVPGDDAADSLSGLIGGELLDLLVESHLLSHLKIS